MQVNRLGVFSTVTRTFLFICLSFVVASAFSAEQGRDFSNLYINEIQVSNLDRFVDTSYNYGGWIELYNPTDSIYNLTGFYISDDASNLFKSRSLVQIIKPHSFCVYYFGHYSNLYYSQIDFNLDADGGMLYFTNPKGETVIELEYPECITRTSWARTTDGGDEWAYTDEPTLNSSNNKTTYATDRLSEPQPSVNSCLFDTNFNFTVSMPEGVTLRYTTNGSVPTLSNGQTSDTGEFAVTETAFYRFRFFADGFLASPVVTRSFIKSSKKTVFPVSSIVTDKKNLYDEKWGIMTIGINGIPGLGSSSANWNQDWERVANFEYIHPDGTVSVNQEVQMSICGGWTRRFSPHPYKLKADKACEGQNYYDERFFVSDPHLRQKAVRMRAGGQDTECRFMDGAISTIIKTSGLDVDVEAYQPVHTFINGEYQGLLNVRETSGKQYVKTHFGYDDEDIDMFEHGCGEGKYLTKYGYTQTCGTQDALNELYALSKNSTNDENYQKILNLLDIDEYINYMAAELYMGNGDWAPQTNNLKAWRPREENGRFRFTMFDFDQIFLDYVFNSFASDKTIENFSTGKTEEDAFKNMFGRLCANETFRKRFIDTYCLVSGSVFDQQRVSAVVDSLVNDVEDSYITWDNRSKLSAANRIKNSCSDGWASNMHTKMRSFKPLQASSLTKIKTSFAANIPHARLFLNEIQVPTNRFTGRLYLPAKLRTEAPEGYRFTGWRQVNSDNTIGKLLASAPEYKLTTYSPSSIIACYERIPSFSADKPHVYINEVCASNEIAVNDYGKQADWLELYNNSEVPVDINGYVLKAIATDSTTKESVISPAPGVPTLMKPHERLIIWCDGKPGETELHASFKLANDTVLLVCMPSKEMSSSTAFADTLLYLPHRWNESVGRFPDGGKNCYVMTRPSIDAPNRLSYYSQLFDENALRTGLCNPTITNLVIPESSDAVYDMQGRCIPQDDIHPSMYILNGKKYLNIKNK